jgi:DNA-binding beta-propeller fold protein YncE
MTLRLARSFVSSIALVLAAISATHAAESPHSAGKLVLVAGGGAEGDGAPAVRAKVTNPFGVDFDRAGNMIIVEMNGHKIRKVAPNGIITSLGGNGAAGFAGDGGPMSGAQVNGPHNLAIAPNDDIFIADTWNSRVRKIDGKTGIITTIAGIGGKGFGGDGGLATQAQCGHIYCASLDPQGENIYLADLDNRRIRAVNLKTGIIRTVAGNGQRGVPEDGADAVASPLVDPRAVAVSQGGMVWILERSGHALRTVDSQGKIRTVVGTGQRGASGDGGDARLATLNGPKHLCFDLQGNVIIADTENHVIRKYLVKEGKIVRVAGNGNKGTAGLGGPPDQAELNQPHGVYMQLDGTLYISDSSNNRVLKIAK